MARKRLSMLKIKEMLRLKNECGLSIRKISKSCSVSRPVVSDYLKLVESNKLGWAEAKFMSDEEIRVRLLGIKQNGIISEKVVPDWNYIHQEIKKPHMTLALLWQEYRAEQPAGYQYSRFSDLYGQWRKKLRLTMRQTHKAGEKLFVDYCDGLSIVDRESGEKILTQLFVGVWGASNYTYAEASLRQDKESWLMAHVRALEYSQAVPRIVVPDNLKSGINHACKYEPEINRSYQELAEHYGFAVIPARPYHPKDKAKVEVGVLVVERWILASLRNRIFYSLAELNEAIWNLLEKLNIRGMQKHGLSRREQFEQLDKPAALSLPVKRYEYAEWKKARVNIDYHIEVGKNYYSVPFQLRGESVDVRISGFTIEIFHKNRRQASHVRSYKKRQYTTLPEHMPEAHRKYLEWSPSRIIAWAQKTGPNTKMVVENILSSRKYPEQVYRSCLGILRLTKNYSVQRLENACMRASHYRAFSYNSIRTILARGLDQQADLSYPSVEKVSLSHENIRGQHYYDSDGKQLNQQV